MSDQGLGRVLECDLLVLGASFTGIEVMHRLRRNRMLSSIDVVVVDMQTEHGYIPLVHELVAGKVDPASYVLRTAEYVRSLPRTTYIEDCVVSLDAKQRQVLLASGLLVRAQAMVLALGSKVKTPRSLGLCSPANSAKFLAQGLELRRQLEACSPGRLIVIGGGITGVEMAGELALWTKRNAAGFSVTLIHTKESLLTSSCPAAGLRARRLLEELGVEVLLQTRVSAIETDHVVLAALALGNHDPLQSCRKIDCVLSVWAGGIRPATGKTQLGVYCDDDGWIEVDPTLRCRNAEGQPMAGIFAGGDAVRVYDESGRWPTMNRAIECIWQAKVLAQNAGYSLQARGDDQRKLGRALIRHRLVRAFPYGISIGTHSLVLFRRFAVDLGALGAAFRRWLMRRYFARYRPRSP